MPVGNRIGRARLDAVPAKNAPGVVYVVNAGVALARGNPLRVGVFCGLDVNATCRAGRRTQETTHTFLKPVFVTMKHMNSAISRLEMHGLFRIVFRDRRAQHIAKRHAEALHQRDKRFAGFFEDGCHRISV